MCRSAQTAAAPDRYEPVADAPLVRVSAMARDLRSMPSPVAGEVLRDEGILRLEARGPSLRVLMDHGGSPTSWGTYAVAGLAVRR